MVVSTHMPGLKVEVTVNGEALKEYIDHDLKEEERTTTRFVESISGQLFQISLQLLPEFKYKGNTISFEVYADGKLLHQPLLTKGKHSSSIVEGIKENGNIRTLRFASLETVSDGRARYGEVAKVQELGTIVVKASHERTFGRTKMVRVKRASKKTVTEDRVGIISEKALKGASVSHTVEFGEVISKHKPGKKSGKTQSTKPIPNLPAPFATIVFNYRSYAMLKSMLIIPRTPSPPPLVDRDITTLNHGELRELQRMAQELKGLRDTSVKVKREKPDDDPRPRKVANAQAGDTLLELEDDGGFRERSETLQPKEKVVIEID